jgi:hypothetical protein
MSEVPRWPHTGKAGRPSLADGRCFGKMLHLFGEARDYVEPGNVMSYKIKSAAWIASLT